MTAMTEFFVAVTGVLIYNNFVRIKENSFKENLEVQSIWFLNMPDDVCFADKLALYFTSKL